MRIPLDVAHSVVRALHTIRDDSSLSDGGNITQTSIQIPSSQPAWAEPLSPNLAAFSIEMDRWPDWAGQKVGEPNEYVNQVLTNLGERTGAMPYLRVGANSEDRATLDLSYEVMNATFPAPTAEVPVPEADHIFIGRDFYALSGNLPDGTPFQWGINLASLNRTETIAQAKLVADTFQGERAHLTANVNLDALEIGNEPDFYADGKKLGAAWTPANYSHTWLDYAQGVSEVIQLGGDGPYLTPGAMAGFETPVWTPEAFFEAGILGDDNIRAVVKQFNQHVYSGAFGDGYPLSPVGGLMDKGTVRTNLTTRANGLKAAKSEGLQYVFSEGNSYANHGQPGTSNTAEGALWAIDWMLQLASMGIERMHFHHGVGFRYNFFQPVATDAEHDDGLNMTQRAHILPVYHAALIVNEAIGTNGNSYVAEINTANDNVVAYGIWEDGDLVRMVVTSTEVYTTDDEEAQEGRNKFEVNLVGVEGRNATVKRLFVPQTTAMHGLTWAGQSFDTEDGKPTGEVSEETLDNGVLQIDASSAVLICFK
ncbi:hypothetical protein C343_05260 [Cryptococcus neoformans C23]|uniref:Beta-glucuronidase C-terminal domain-containing protein n=2 Tax=Cryptococcus neoformans TaxID=5207 RepID=J9VZF1_CRYN9|nr:hypothetical protein CNAG_04394 [Cryptococcus neoformans var. grubii H99]XP_012051770.1 hypothetical protein CNAG_04374 [Cryptococcus neoformans var. grubii H99]AUB27087.1 hypothetical protein CKF44_04374 [Cryptococcus neoformans var. grubii]OWZ29412.1 hypothetical protein C347_05287 [Cryptococcus neoformans var. grubii AD2-60a]OWZ41277.1 hypothetical protein C343_05240 [Cryptococcus neoformans var. grubii C23]OXG16006.1 hypothetical protein C361_05454 [Cryptococcus neoformans var. grubii T|eukprot:XP_012051519.1 hypothetical protein CNAG_04394 [Cryptococcus neoformans var. grubii H99]